MVKFAITRQIHYKKWNISSKISYFFKRSGNVLINFMNIILCKKNLARTITWLDFWLISLSCKNHTFTLNTLKLKVRIDTHIEQCNVVVIIKYEIKSMKTLEDTVS